MTPSKVKDANASAVYGTVILYLDSVKPTCWKTQRRAREGLTHAMIWSTWAQVIFLL